MVWIWLKCCLFTSNGFQLVNFLANKCRTLWCKMHIRNYGVSKKCKPKCYTEMILQEVENVLLNFSNTISDRELAYQIADQFRVFGKYIGLKDAVIVGGIGEFLLSLQFTPPSLNLNLLCTCRHDEAESGTCKKTSCCHSNPRQAG